MVNVINLTNLIDLIIKLNNEIRLLFINYLFVYLRVCFKNLRLFKLRIPVLLTTGVICKLVKVEERVVHKNLFDS